MNRLWPDNVIAWRNAHLISADHIQIMRVAWVESFLLEQYNIAPDCEDVPQPLRTFANIALMQIWATSDEDRERFDKAMRAALDQYKAGAH